MSVFIKKIHLFAAKQRTWKLCESYIYKYGSKLLSKLTASLVNNVIVTEVIQGCRYLHYNVKL